MHDQRDFVVRTLGEARHPSPLHLSTEIGDGIADYIPEGAGVLYDIDELPGRERSPLLLERAGPRQELFFDPATTRAAVVTCGGLCPGLNNVIRSLFVQLYYNYGVRTVLGIRYGYLGLNEASGLEPLVLTDAIVSRIHNNGGTILGSSRGPQEVAVMLDFLRKRDIHMLFTIGGDGTQRGALAVSEEARRQGYPMSVIGIPKTIDNDIRFVQRTFGYTTAVDVARAVLDSAHNEAKGAPNGIALVKLMGRDSGFIAAGAVLASQEANFCLVPEIPFDLDGPGGFLNALRNRIVTRQHALVVVAEGAGQEHLARECVERDASGNVLHGDVGVFLRDRIARYFREQGPDVTIKYIDPSYLIRSVAANSEDSVICDVLARHAVHAALAGKTEMIVGMWNSRFVHIPIPVAVKERKKLDPEGEFWNAVLLSTGQPTMMRNP